MTLKLLFGVKEKVVYGDSYPIYVKRKGEEIKVGYITVINNLPVPPDSKEDIVKEARKAKVVMSFHRRYFRKLTPEHLAQLQERVDQFEI